MKFQTIGGKTNSTMAILLTEIAFPEFDSNIAVDSQITNTFDKTCLYDILFGANFLDNTMKIILPVDVHVYTDASN